MMLANVGQINPCTARYLSFTNILPTATFCLSPPFHCTATRVMFGLRISCCAVSVKFYASWAHLNSFRTIFHVIVCCSRSAALFTVYIRTQYSMCLLLLEWCMCRGMRIFRLHADLLFAILLSEKNKRD